MPRQGDFDARGAYTLLMGSVALLMAIFIAGYFVGVWTACVVLRQPQRAYEDGLSRSVPARSIPAIPDLAQAVELEG